MNQTKVKKGRAKMRTTNQVLKIRQRLARQCKFMKIIEEINYLKVYQIQNLNVNYKIYLTKII